ncbi:MAG: hypothetical protein K6T80_00465 [Firmicutes bacterium]|nr:hypothetical protein [Bacillota bacterium]
MKGRIASLAVLAAMIISFIGAGFGQERLKTAGNLSLLVIATVAGYHFLKFYLLNPVREFHGVCLNKNKSQNGYLLTFKTVSGGLVSGESSQAVGDKIKIGDRAMVKAKGRYIIDLEKQAGR